MQLEITRPMNLRLLLLSASRPMMHQSMHLPVRPGEVLFFGALLLGAPAEAARRSPACAGLTQKAASLAAEDIFQANLLLFSAAAAGCEDLVADLLRRGAAINARDRLGRTALALAAKEGRERLVEVLTERGAAIDARAISGATPLFLASEADHSSIVRYLVAHGADVNLTGTGGSTPLIAAAFNGNFTLIGLFLMKGADANALDASGKTAIVYAASRGFTHAVARLIEAGVDVNRRYEHGLTALMWAAGYADGAGIEDIRDVLALLIARGAALDLRDDRGFTAYQIARDLGHREIADYLAAQNPAR
jgi:ankyrin repeat protein